MSSISLFTAVEYNSSLGDPNTRGWCTRQLDSWTFPFLGKKIEVVKFDTYDRYKSKVDRNVAHYTEKTIESRFLETALRAILLATVIFPSIVLITRAIIRRNTRFTKVVDSTPAPAPAPARSSLKKEELNKDVPLLSEHEDNKVSVGKPFSIKLSAFCMENWNISPLPTFIQEQDQLILLDITGDPDACSGRIDSMFTFVAKEPGTGSIEAWSGYGKIVNAKDKKTFKITAK